jgi:hypothetical protein
VPGANSGFSGRQEPPLLLPRWALLAKFELNLKIEDFLEVKEIFFF